VYRPSPSRELVAAGSMRLARRPIERVEIRAVGAEAAVRATAPEKSRHVTDRPVEHARELDHEVELRNAGARYELRGIPPQRPGQLLARPPLVRLRQFQELLQPLLSYGRRIHGANPSSPSCPSSSKADGAALRLPPPASAATNVAIDKAATGQRRKNCVFSSRALKGRSAAERQPERNSAAFSEPARLAAPHCSSCLAQPRSPKGCQDKAGTDARSPKGCQDKAGTDARNPHLCATEARREAHGVRRGEWTPPRGARESECRFRARGPVVRSQLEASQHFSWEGATP
jgi:hypothetical protein